MDYFKLPSYSRDPVSVTRAYTENMIAYLRRLHPDTPVAKIQAFVTAEIERSLVRPTLKMIDYPSYGNARLATVDLLTYTDNMMRKNIVTPAGGVYMPSSVKESLLKRRILANTALRKVYKKAMLLAKMALDFALEQRNNNLQSFTKVENNAMPGAFGSPHNFIFDIPNYNAVTATARHCIMSSYAHVEKMLEGNYYFPRIDACINYIIQLVRLCPKDLAAVVGMYEIYIPSVDDVVEHFQTSFRLYTRVTAEHRRHLDRTIRSLSDMERTFVFYGYCLKTLMRRNDRLFRAFLTDFFRTDVDVDLTADPNDIFKLNSDLLAVLSGLNADIIKRKTVSDAINEEPDGVRHLLAIGRHMQAKLDSFGRLFAAFLRIDCDVPDAMAHPAMIRKTVILSDTDSVIFSTQHWIEWYTGGVSFETDAYRINAFVVFMVSMTLEQVFARLSTNFGAEAADIGRIVMKNEFLYSLMLRTPLKKNYAGISVVQEGFVLPKPKEDIKGPSFRDSKMCRETQASGKKFLNWIFDTVTKVGHLTVGECLEQVLKHERMIIKSLEAGERTFLTTKPVKNAEDYKKVAVSDHYYWRLWEEVFRPNFGAFIIPGKGYDIPLLGEGHVLKDARYLSRLQAFDPALHARLLRFIEENPRKITRLIVPMTLKQIPPIIRPLIDIRSIVYANSTPFIVIMRSLGIGYTDTDHQILLSDLYDIETESLAQYSKSDAT